MFIRRITPVVAITILSFSLVMAYEVHGHNTSSNEIVIDSSYHVISSYDAQLEEVLVQFNLDSESIVGLELYNRAGKMIKVWNPEIAHKGTYRAILPVSDIPDGTYRLNIFINDQNYQQAVFKY